MKSQTSEVWPTEQPGPHYAVIDTTLLTRLVQLDIAEYLPYLFKKIHVPPEVRAEASDSPDWQQLARLLNESAGFFVDCLDCDVFIRDYLKAELDAGEAAAIAQADRLRMNLLVDVYKGHEQGQMYLLMDERRGHGQARLMELSVIRAGRLLWLFKKAGAITTVKPYLLKLHELGFHLTEKAFNEILVLANEAVD
jgi:predicted nucleic acid-binding protein